MAGVLGLGVGRDETEFVEFVAALSRRRVSSIVSASLYVSPLARSLRDMLAFEPLLLYIRESAAQKILFHSTSLTPSGAGSASGYLYLKGFALDAVAAGLESECGGARTGGLA